ncbi:MAG: hypothetical protein ABSA51_07540 [Anaerolineaceae bacterium]
MDDRVTHGPLADKDLDFIPCGAVDHRLDKIRKDQVAIMQLAIVDGIGKEITITAQGAEKVALAIDGMQ